MNLEGAAILGVFFVAIVFSFLTVVFHGFGLLWAVPGAMACARIANEKGLDDKVYIIRGALYSALNFWLWFYFMKRMQGKDISDFLLRLFFIFLFVNWFLSSIFYSFMWAEILSGRSEDAIEIVVAVAILRICGAISAILWVVSLVRLMKAPYYKYSYHGPSQPEQKMPPTMSAVYLMPCVFSLVFIVAPNAIAAALFTAIE